MLGLIFISLFSNSNSKCILGLCFGSSFDDHFAWTGEYSQDTESYYFRGFQTTMLIRDDKLSQWKLINYNEPHIQAISNTASYPFGTHTWYIYNDTCIYATADQIVENEKNTYKIRMNFNVCDEKDEFNCADGIW